MNSVGLRDPESGERLQSTGEEIANSISHGVGFAAALVSAPLLIRQGVRRGPASAVVGACVFAAAIAFLYLTSTLYHALPHGKAKRIFRLIEHMAIFILIAGTYTPFTLGVLHGPWGWTLFELIWTLAIAGLALKAVGGIRYPGVSLGLYLLMGWVVLIAVQPLWLRMPHRGFFWIFLGGLAYTAGVVFYAFDHRLRFSHFIWHLFVIAGTVFHFIAVYRYALPP